MQRLLSFSGRGSVQSADPVGPPSLCLSCGDEGCSLCQDSSPKSNAEVPSKPRRASWSLPFTSSQKTKFSSLAPPTSEQGRELAESMPKLAGMTLQPPRFHPTEWLLGQSFSAADDPDRTREPWPAPAFIESRDPTSQRAKTSVQELHVPVGEGMGPDSFARVVFGVLEEEDCAQLISRVNSKGFTPALINVGGGYQRLITHARDGHRVIVDCPELSTWLLEVLRPYLPEKFASGETLLDFNERCRVLCYTPGQSFPEHHDGCFRKPTGERSMVTVQVYLHDVPAEKGGATTFLWRGSNVPCNPMRGSVLLFTQDLLHEGSLLKSGLKYTLRTEAMYRACAP